MRSLGKTYLIILALLVLLENSTPIFALSDQRLCADPKCQGVISLAKASISYAAPEKGLVSFKINSKIRVKSKSAGSDPSLWGIEVNGRQGYAPKKFIREEKVFISDKNLKHIVPVEPVQGDKGVDVPKEKLNPSEVSTKAQTSETVTKKEPTPPLNSKPNAEATTLSSSEGEVVTPTTAPLTQAMNAEVVNKSIKEMATPVLNKMEIVDGTAIPVLEELETGSAKEEVQPAIKKETTTTKNDKIEIENANEDFGKPNDSKTESEEIKSQYESNQPISTEQTPPKNFENKHNGATRNLGKIDTITTKGGEIKIEQANEDLSKPNEPKGAIKENKLENESASSLNLEQTPSANVENQHNVTTLNSEKVDAIKLADAAIKAEDIGNKAKNAQNISKSEKVAEEIVSENLANQKVEKHIELTKTTENVQNATEDKSEAKTSNETQAIRSDNNQIKTETLIKSPSESVEPKASKPTQNNALLDAYVDNEDDFDDEEDDEGFDDGEDIDGEQYEPNLKSSSAEITTESPQQVTDSGFTTAPNKHYWEADKTDATTIAPVPINVPNVPSSKEAEEKPADVPITLDSEKPIVNSPEVNSTTPEKVVKDSVLIPEVTPILKLKPTTEAKKESTTTETPQVPITTTTLPIYQQPQVESKEQAQQIKNVDNEPHNQELAKDPVPHISKPLYDPYYHITPPSKEGSNYENPKDYYSSPTQNTQTLNSMEISVSTEIPVNTKAEFVSEETHSSESTGTTESVVNHNTATSIGNDRKLDAGSIELTTTPSPQPVQSAHDSSKEQIPIHVPIDEKRDDGLFGTILGTVNTFLNKLRKQEPQSDGEQTTENDVDVDDELQRILYPNHYEGKMSMQEGDDGYCEQLSPNNCPKSKIASSSVFTQQCRHDWQHIDMDNFVEIFVAKAFEMRELLSCLVIASSTVLLFLFGYYCFCNSNREGTLISKLNLLERSLLASHKENAILKDDLQKTRNKLTSIEDNSFGSNDMVVALRKELEITAEEKRQLEAQIHSLEKELETAAEAGLELNKIVAELINNQTGQESLIMNSVEDLQMQFNEQQKTILEINTNLAEKSRENSELQLMLAEQNVRFNGEIASLQQDNDELEAEKSALQTRLSELKTEFEEDISKALEGKNVEIKRLQNEIVDLNNRFEDIHTKWQTGLAKIEALEECMKALKKDAGVNIADIINVANVRAELLDLQKQRATLKNRLEVETEARQHAELSLQNTISEVDKLKQDFHQSEKDKLEAQTRLEVLSNYFKEKETQLQKELSLKEAIWLKQQGENTSTVDRLTTMQEEIQSLKSQNDALRAEIEAQLAAHKAQTGTLENRAHETWLAARQSERRFEEARAEAAALRRRLTELAGQAANVGEGNRNNIDGKVSITEFNNAPSPIMPPPPLMDANAGSPLLGTLPPPPHQFLPFMGPPPPPFMNLPPPPFLQSVEMRPAPLGRMMSPTLGRYSPNDRERKRRSDDYYEREYDDDYDDDDYDVEEDDYDYDEEDEQDERARSRRPRRRSGNGSDSEWHRDNYSPPPPDRSYRSQSPTDSRYNYTYDDETDLSPPPSPPGRRGRGGGGGSRTGSYHTFSPRSANNVSPNAVPERTSKKGIPNSDSDKSHNSTRHNKKGKSMV